MQQMINVAIITNSIGGVKTPPYSTIGKGDVGGDACIAPQRPPMRADIESAPTVWVQRILGPEGVNMEGDEKTLRKLQHSCNF